jgi:hypothetical protein
MAENITKSRYRLLAEEEHGRLSEEHHGQIYRFFDMPYDREQIIRDRCWTVLQMQRHRAMLGQQTGGGAGSQT